MSRIAFPLGGIGTGCVSLAGRGALVDFEWWNHPGKGYSLPDTFFALAASPLAASGPVRARVLAGSPAPPFDVAGFGSPREQGQGLPHFARARFRGAYPLAHVRLDDARFPLAAQLEAWNPLVPLDPEASGLPLAVLRYRIRNRSTRALRVSIFGSLFNAVGLDGHEVPVRGRHGALGGNRNRVVHGPAGLVGLHLTQQEPAAQAPRRGSLLLGVLDPIDPTVQSRWPRGPWFDGRQLFWDGLLARGRLADTSDDTPSPAGTSDAAAIGDVFRLGVGATRDVVFLLTWYFPDFVNTWNPGEARVAGQPLRTHYGARFASAFDVACHAASRLASLEAATSGFRRAFFAQTLPAEVLDAASSQLSTLRTPTCLRLDDGSFHAFEGCLDRTGCCPMDCTHVWNYAQALPHVWPGLERTLRETGLGPNLFEDGRQAFRSLLPARAGARFDRKPAADGQLGEILKLHRDWRISGDTTWMRTLWPAARRALEHVFVQWDADRDGVIDGEQHVTYDVELFGPNPLTGWLYVAALQAGAELARAAGDPDAARRYARLARAGAGRLERRCWNGEYYVQRLPAPAAIRSDAHATGSLGGSLEGVAPGEPPRYQIGEGCLADQLLGAWMARACGLASPLPSARAVRVLRAILRHNFRRDLHEHPNPARVYALGDEAGLVLCSWPRGGRPERPFPYADEVWTGVEYQVAAHLIWEGLVREGLALVRAVRARFDGARRNPWDETECGHHYARAMSSWTLLHALAGFAWDGVAARLAFAPRFAASRFRFLFTAGSAWGEFEQRRRGRSLAVELRVRGGRLRLARLGLAWPGKAPRGLRLEAAPAGARLRRGRSGALEVVLPAPVALDPGARFALRVGPPS